MSFGRRPRDVLYSEPDKLKTTLQKVQKLAEVYVRRFKLSFSLRKPAVRKPGGAL